MREWLGLGVYVGSPEGPHRSLGLGEGELGGGARRQVSKPGTRPTPREGGRAARPSAPRASAEVSGALASCPPAGTEGWKGGGPLPGFGVGEETETAARAAPSFPGQARALTVGAVALPRARHLLRPQAALDPHREAVQHVGDREQVRRLHAARLIFCAVGTVESASSRGYCAGRRELGPGRAPREVISALGPSPTTVAAAASEARARMRRPQLPPRGGAEPAPAFTPLPAALASLPPPRPRSARGPGG